MVNKNHGELQLRRAMRYLGLRLAKSKARSSDEEGYGTYGLYAHGEDGRCGLYGEPHGTLMFSKGVSGYGLTLGEVEEIVADVLDNIRSYVTIPA